MLNSAQQYEESLIYNLDYIPNCALIIDKDGFIRDHNQEFSDSNKLAPNEYIGENIKEVLTETSYKLINSYIKENHLSKLSGISLNFIGKHKQVVTYSAQINKISHQNNNYFLISLIPRLLIKNINPINLDKFANTNDELKKLTKTSELINDNFQIGTWYGSFIDNNNYLSQTCRKIFNIAPNDIIPPVIEWGMFYHEDERTRITELAHNAMINKTSYSFFAKLASNNQNIDITTEERYVKVSGIFEYNENGDVVGVYGITQDKTEEINQRLRLEESEKLFRRISETSKDITAVYDLLGKFEYISPSIENILGYSPEDLIGKSLMDITHPQDFESLMHMYDDYILCADWKQAIRVKYRAYHIDGTLKWLESNSSIIVNEETGAPLKFQDSIRDVTYEEEILSDLAKVTIDANEAAEAKAQFLATMSHELRTPLTSIIGFSSLLRELSKDNELLNRYSNRVYSASQGLLSLINDILDHSKLEAGQIELETEEASFIDLVLDVTDLLSIQAKTKNIKLNILAPDDFPDKFIFDEVRMRQVLQNLIGNAIKFTPEGKVDISFKITSDNYLILEIKDTGIGISKEGQEKLFKKFSQVDNFQKNYSSGTGLGLMICKQIIELMNGKIEVYSELGIGSIFTVEIPIETIQIENNTQIETAKKILIVDDYESNIELITALISPFNYAIRAENNGALAINACLEEKFDLIFMDINMPIMDGISATKIIRNSCELNNSTRIIGLTADDTIKHKECKKIGMNDILSKPINNSLLNSVLSSV